MIFALAIALLGSGSGFKAAQAPIRRRLAASQDATPTAEPTRKYCNPSDISDALQGSFISEVAHAACPALRGEPQPSHCACAQVVVDTARFLEKLPAVDCVFSDPDGNGGVLDAITEWAPLNLEKCAGEDFSTAGWGRASGNGGVVGGPMMHYRVLDQGETTCPTGWSFLETAKECEEASLTHVAMKDGEFNGEKFSDSVQRLPFCWVGPHGGANWNPNPRSSVDHAAEWKYEIDLYRSDGNNFSNTVTVKGKEGETFKVEGCSATLEAGVWCQNTYGIANGVRTVVDSSGKIVGTGVCCNGVQNTIVDVRASHVGKNTNRLVCKRPVDVGYPAAAMPNYDYVYGTKGKLCEETTGANGELVGFEAVTGANECEDAYDSLNAANGRDHSGTAGWNAHSVYIPSGCSVNDANGRHWNSQFATVFKTGGNARFDLTPICRRKQPLVDGATLIASGALGDKGCQSTPIGNHGYDKTLEECLGLCKADGAAFMQYHPLNADKYCSCWSSCERTRPASDFLSLADTYEIIWTESPTSDPTQSPTNEPTSEPTNEPTSEPTPAPTQPARFAWGIKVEHGTHGTDVDPYGRMQSVCPESYKVIEDGSTCEDAAAWIQQGNNADPRVTPDAYKYRGWTNHHHSSYGCCVANGGAGFGLYLGVLFADKSTSLPIVCELAANASA